MIKKRKLSDVAKDLGMEAAELIAFYEKTSPEKPKKAGTGLTETEVNAALEHFTQKKQVDSFDEYFATRSLPRSAFEKKEKPVEKKPEKKSMKKTDKKTEAAETKTAQKTKKQPEKKAEPKMEAKPETKAAETKNEKPAVQEKQPERRNDKKKQPKTAQKHGERLHVEVEMSSGGSSTVEKRRTVDTRGSYVDLDKYNQRYEQMASSGKYGKDNYSSKKQKINQKSAQRNKQKYSSKKETEQDKLRRLELERARKQQLKVLIPDTIVVSELAARLKVTATEVIKKLMMLGVMATVNQVVD
ncbi:MAG: translation initiation factor IF-2 N-terminal domain-containing protein [Oscillospiraceae bacterium]|nr:translation initiation factor IF-2 N-terminal domain-containing protein [Oscillospiraceae bacterium]